MRQKLDDLDVTHEQNLSRHRLGGLLRRARQGMLRYTNCSHEEIVAFLRQRGITDVSTRVKVPNERLIARLEYADNHSLFKSFLELPPDLPIAIYETAMLHGEGGKPAAICLLNKQSWESTLQCLAVA